MLKDIVKKLVVWILTWEARLVLRTYRPRIVAITGSVGKTSAKDAIFAVVGKGAHARKSQKSFNSELGLPLTILGLPNAWQNPLGWAHNIFDGLLLLLFRAKYPEWLILEVGADRPGDIRNVVPWLPVDVVVMTGLPEIPVHVEYFASPEEVVEEKASLIDALKPGGALILLADDKKTRALASRLPAPDARIITFGFSKDADVRGEHFTFVYEEREGRKWPIGVEASVVSGEESMPVRIMGSGGSQAFLPALAAAAVGQSLGKNLAEMAEALSNYAPPPGRMRLLPGIKETLIVDDSYNSSPAAVLAGLEALKLLKVKGKVIAVLGDMTELGRYSIEKHREVGKKVAEVADVLFTVGFRARGIAESALDNGMADSAIVQFEDAARAGKELEALLQAGDCVFVKGSQSMRMEKVVEEIMAEPERAKELLVRQDREWKKR